MMTHQKLVELYRELRDEDVLSVYIDSDQHDPAERSKWRKELEGLLAKRRSELAEDGRDEDLDRFAEAWSRLEDRLNDFDAFIPEKGWVGFATPDQVWYAEEVPVPMPHLVSWEKGIRVAPYIRGLKQERTVVVVLVDSQRARVFEYRDGAIEEATDLRADTFLGDLSDVGVRKRSHMSSGVRGETSTDQAQRILEVSSDRMLKQLMQVVGEHVGDDGYLVLGGTPEMVRHAAEATPGPIRERTAERPSMHFDMSLTEVKEATEEAASELSRRRQSELLEQVIDQARADGRACLGPEETEQALHEMRVDTLLVSRNFREDRPDFADHAVGTAFAQDADVEELSGDAAERLDEEGDGIGARLRFKIRNSVYAEEE